MDEMHCNGHPGKMQNIRTNGSANDFLGAHWRKYF